MFFVACHLFVGKPRLDYGGEYFVDRVGEGDWSVVVDAVTAAFVFEDEDNSSPKLILWDYLFVPPLI